MIAIVLAHNFEAVSRHRENWGKAFDAVQLITPVDSYIPGSIPLGMSEKAGIHSLGRLWHAMTMATLYESACVMEYDTIFLKTPEPIRGALLCSQNFRNFNQQFSGATYPHSPWIAEREVWLRLLQNAPESLEGGFPDRWLGLAAQQAGVPILSLIGAYSNDSEWGPMERMAAARAVAEGAPVIHGIKTAQDYDTVVLVPKKPSWDDIPGWFNAVDAECYAQIVDAIPEGGTFVEIGSWLGRSMACFNELRGTKRIAMHAVDTFMGTPNEAEIQGSVVRDNGGNIRGVFQSNMTKHGAIVFIHEGDSVKCADSFGDGACDAIFIDGDHSYEGVKRDIDAYLPKVRPGGIIAGHDYDYPSVRMAVREVFPNAQLIGRCWMATLNT